MGKAKKLRSVSHKKKASPMGGPTQAEIEEAARADYSTLAPADAQVFQGLVDLQGSVREATCVAIATMFGDVADEAQERKSRAKLQQMLDAGLLKKLIPRMADPLPMVRLHAIGAMRNISVTGGLEVCELLTAQNVITPLARVITDNATDDTFANNDLTAVSLLEQAIALLANVSESCQSAINELTQANLLPAIMKLAERARNHMALHIETLKLLLLITDSNPRLNEEFGSNAQYQAVIGDIIQKSGVSTIVKLHTVGIAMNVRAIMDVDANVARLLPIVESALAYNAAGVLQLAQEVSDNWELSQKSVLEDENVDDDTLTPEEKQQILDAQTKLRTWKDSVRVLTLALEHVAQLAAGNDENDDEEEWASDDEDAMEEYAASHMDTGGGRGVSGSPAAKAIASSQVFARCVTILQGVISLPELSARVIVNDFERIRIRVCNAVNNLVQTVSWEVMGEDVVPQIFQNLCTLYASLKNESDAAAQQQRFEVDESDDELEVAVTAAMWSALRRAAAQDKSLPISGEQAQLIMTTATQSRAVDARMNAIGMMGCVGQRSKDVTENAVIGRCLIATLNDSSLEVVAQALDAVFDVYGDEDFDDNFRSLQFLSALERTSAAVKSKLRVERKDMDRDLVAHIKETQLNLARFIKYKKKHL